METKRQNDKRRKDKLRQTLHRTRWTPSEFSPKQTSITRQTPSYIFAYINAYEQMQTHIRLSLEVLDKGSSKDTKNCLETRHSSQSTIKNQIEVDPINQPIRKIMDKYRIKNQVKLINQNKEVNNDRLKVNNN
ncbi:unnamed protein product [Schistosoma mattheei]|uniref:Uncharacterized protein n=1 Tax=Schistosoma mattheei TaxID=31246 RepID=A0A183Q4K5_9TREM|nr:unnamed protein product [Schistosoma mattheei]